MLLYTWHATIRRKGKCKSYTILVNSCSKGILYRLLANHMKQKALLTSSDNLCELWQRRFGQRNYGSLPLLKDMLVGFSDFKVERIQVCKEMWIQQACQGCFPKRWLPIKRDLWSNSFRSLWTHAIIIIDRQSLWCYFHRWFFQENLGIFNEYQDWDL